MPALLIDKSVFENTSDSYVMHLDHEQTAVQPSSIPISHSNRHDLRTFRSHVGPDGPFAIMLKRGKGS